jgi:hypothetical protein
LDRNSHQPDFGNEKNGMDGQLMPDEIDITVLKLI